MFIEGVNKSASKTFSILYVMTAIVWKSLRSKLNIVEDYTELKIDPTHEFIKWTKTMLLEIMKEFIG